MPNLITNGISNRLKIDEFLLEVDVCTLIEQIDTLQEHIRATVPDEVLYVGSGELNTRTRWGAVLFHAQALRATLKAFLP